jgi:putative membrane-bound dehydrogenase-like protein
MPFILKEVDVARCECAALPTSTRWRRTFATLFAVGRPSNLVDFFNCVGVVAVVSLILAAPPRCNADEGRAYYSVGVAKQDITPSYPIRLNGFGFRRTESEGVTQPIWAKALAIGADDVEPVVLITLDSLGIRQSMVDEVARRLEKRCGIDRDRLAVTFSHSHTTPKVVGACDTIFGTPIPPDHQAHIQQYTAELTDAMEAVAMAALADRRPSTLSWAVGRVGFAKNRRPQGGPVDHSLPVLVVTSADDDSVRAVYATYACHCVTLSNNKISGDWAGFAQRVIESRHPGAIALTSIGCGSDANPDSGVTLDNTAAAADQGTQIADEVDRLLRGPLTPITGPISAKLTHSVLPLNPPPNRDTLERLAAADDPAGYNAKVELAKLDRGEHLQTSLDYPIQTWEFGDSLAMVFLTGEVCADYSVRLKTDLAADRVWLHGYSNDFCAYIPSERLLKEGGYGGGAEVVYFALPNTFAAGLEDKIVSQVCRQISASYRSAASAGIRLTDSSGCHAAEAQGEHGDCSQPHANGVKNGTSIGGRAAGHVRQMAVATEVQPWPLQTALASIQTKPGLVVEAVATEPLVADPVAIDFAPDGRLWVAEMPDYSQFPDENFPQHGNIRRLTDVDGDGRFDDLSIFADGLRFPTDVKAWRDGVIVCDAPDVIYLEDSDGDGRADVRQVLLTGFETHNAQARVNSLRWGLDNWLYGSCGLFGGTIRTATGKEIALGQRDFRFRPDTGELEPATGRTQQGRARNDWGDWFGCENESLLDHYPLVDRYFARYPRLTPPPPEQSVPQPSAVALHPLGRLTLFKLSGPPGRPTSVCGLEFYRDELLGKEFSNNAFVAEPVNQLVHRLVLTPSGATFTGSVASDEQDAEFLASSDPWFRPVQIRTGPDGCLYVVDMHRAVIEHQKFIPQETLREVDLTAGRDQGRIYRIRPLNTQPRPVVDLTKLAVDELVPLLDSPNGPQRDQVHELLVLRHDAAAVPLLRELVTKSSRAATRLQALCALEALSGLDADLLIAALNDSNAAVRRHAVRLSEPWIAASPTLSNTVFERVDDHDSQVQLQLAGSLGEWGDPRVAPALADIALAHSSDPYVLAGVWSSVDAGNAGAVLVALLARRNVQDIPATVREPAVRLAADLGGADDLIAIGQALAADKSGAFQVWQLDVATHLMRSAGLGVHSKQAVQACVAPLVTFARRSITTGGGNDALALASLRLTAAATPIDEVMTLLAPFIEPKCSPVIQQGAVELAMTVNMPETVDALVAAWPGLSKAARDQAFDAIAARRQLAARVIDLLASGELAANSLDASHRQRLLHHADADICALAAKAFASSINADRAAIVKDYLAKLDGTGDPTHGKELFAKHCSSCHLLEEVGHNVGPDLSAMSTRTVDGLVESILDPNRAVDGRFRSYTALTIDGLTYSGILGAETSNSVTLVDQQAAQRVLLRTDLESLTMSELSLMPEGLERELSPAALNDLLAYLTALNGEAKVLAGNRPKLVVPDHEGVVALRASNSSIYGGEITFEPTWQNIGFWHGANDHVCWEFRIHNPGEFDVYADLACPADTSGNEFVVEGGIATLVGKVAPTGGYDHYQVVKIGRLSFAAEKNSLVVRPKGTLRTRNLMDLRGIYLTPAGVPLRLSLSADAPKFDSTAVTAIARLVDGLAVGTPQEYERIPQIWEIAVAAGRRNNSSELIELLSIAVPRAGMTLADWQVVVLGGGVVNGISDAGDWPQRRINELLQQSNRSRGDWDRTLQQAALLADHPTTPIGTRYDALRILGAAEWKSCEKTVTKYLLTDAEQDLRIGAVQTLADVDSPDVDKLLVDAVAKLDGECRRKAVQGLLRTEHRIQVLAAALATGSIAREMLTTEEHDKLQAHVQTDSDHLR